MPKEINENQLGNLLIRIRDLINRDKAVLQAGRIDQTKEDRQDTHVPQREGTQQTWDIPFERLLAMTRNGDFSGVLDKLNEELDIQRDAHR